MGTMVFSADGQMLDTGNRRFETSPDGRAIAGNALTLQLSDLITGKVIKSFGVEEQGALFTPDGKSLVTVSGEGIKIWQ